MTNRNASRRVLVAVALAQAVAATLAFGVPAATAGPDDEDIEEPTPSASAAPLDTSREATYLSELERAVLREMNKARTDPPGYARARIEPRLKYFKGNQLRLPGQIALVTEEGPAAYKECVQALKVATPLVPLAPSRGLSRAARDHARDQGATGETGHTGRDGSSMSDRIERYGKWQRTIGENISYGDDQGDGVVVSLLVDDGVSSRGHRENIMNGAYKVVGVACGPHPRYGTVCVTDFAGGYQDADVE